MIFDEKDAHTFWCHLANGRDAILDSIRASKTGCLGAKCTAWTYVGPERGGCVFVIGKQNDVTKSIPEPGIAREQNTGMNAVHRENHREQHQVHRDGHKRR